jgi:antitoxin ChpS
MIETIGEGSGGILTLEPGNLQIKLDRVIFLYNPNRMEVQMFTTCLRKVGGSIMLTVPPAILDLLHLHVGATVALTVDRGRLVVEPAPRPRFTLDELLAQCDASAEMSQEDRAWLESKPVGGELL